MKYPGTSLSLGSNDTANVKALKTRLNQLGYGPLTADNPSFGVSTSDAIIKFQHNNQLLEDGVVGKLTWERMFSPRANKPVSSLVLRLRALEIANTQLGVRERTGHNDGAEVKSYLNSVGLGEGYAWCQAFVYWCYERAAKELGIPNPMPKTGGVLDHYVRATSKKVAIVVTAPEEGDLGFMDFGGGKGHIFIVEANVQPYVFSIEGNTNGEGSREGDGVYERSRPKTSAKYLRYV